MLTKFGYAIREIRIHNGELLYDMARKLRVSSSYLSQVETGRRGVPYSWPYHIAKIYGLSLEEQQRLEDLARNNDLKIKNSHVGIHHDIPAMIDAMKPEDKEKLVSMLASCTR